MAETGATAAEQLERVLYVISAASGKAGRSLAELAEALGVEPSRILRDLEDVTARAYYQRPGTVDAFQITNDGRRLHVWTTGEFRRPVRLSPFEALALGLGLRVLAASAAGSESRREELLAFAQRLEQAIAAKAPEELVQARQRFAADDGATGDGSVRAVLRRAAAERRRCRIAYLASGTRRPDERVVHPYLLAYASGAWYVIAHCTKREAVRLFRLDRIVTAEVVEGTFEVPDDFDPKAYIAGGRIYRADEEIEAVVRYSPRIARWVRERGPVEELEDGSVAVRLRVADVHWLVRHVLQHGAEAEVVEPAELRLEVARAAARVLGREAE
ncbi:MAG TPA: WYL domain-containing protein [Longimicrobiales bacterium]|jgi:predicted DNA-binding transcriptional regulator YafY